MKKYLTKEKIVKIAVAMIFCLIYIAILVKANRGFKGYTTSDQTGVEYEQAKVVEVTKDSAVSDETAEGYRRGSLDLKIKILTGRYKGDVVDVTDYLSPMYNVDVKKGDKLTVRIDTTGQGQYQVSVYNYDRTGILIAFIVLFAIALILIGGMQGARAFVGLVFTFVSIVYLVVPLTLKGYHSVIVTIIFVALTSFVSLYLLGGIQPKTLGAMLGCLAGVCFAAILGLIASKLIHISAYQMEEAEALMLVKNDYNLKMRGLFLSGIIIASLGAVMDISMSIASGMDEIKLKKPELTAKELFASGMKIGRDASGTMANTLVLAFAGSSFNMMLLIYSYKVSFIQLMNTDFIAIELIRGIAGSLGILFAVPCVSLVTAFLLEKKK